jgi:hypothetical protein
MHFEPYDLEQTQRLFGGVGTAGREHGSQK